MQDQIVISEHESIPELRARMEAAEFCSPTWCRLQAALKQIVIDDVQRALAQGEMPVFMARSIAIAIHPSARQPGRYQATRYSEDGLLGDSQYVDLASAIVGEGLWFRERMSTSDASAFLAKALAGEERHQHRLAEWKAGNQKSTCS